MRNFKILAVAAGFAAAAGITTAGTIYVDGVSVGTYTGNVTVTGTGDIRFPSSTTLDGTGDNGGNTCTNDQDSTVADCQSAPWDACEHTATGSTDIDPWSPGCQEDTNGGDPGDGGSVPANCTGVGLSSAWTRDLEYSGYASFPPPSGIRHEYALKRQKYFSIKFTVPTNSASWGLIGWDGRPGPTNAIQTYAFSKCPGDFAEMVESTGICKKGNTASGSIYFATSGSTYANSSWLCTLDVGETYYLNIAYGRGTSNSSFSNTCPDNSCGAYFDWKTN